MNRQNVLSHCFLHFNDSDVMRFVDTSYFDSFHSYRLDSDSKCLSVFIALFAEWPWWERIFRFPRYAQVTATNKIKPHKRKCMRKFALISFFAVFFQLLLLLFRYTFRFTTMLSGMYCNENQVIKFRLSWRLVCVTWRSWAILLKFGFMFYAKIKKQEK